MILWKLSEQHVELSKFSEEKMKMDNATDYIFTTRKAETLKSLYSAV